MTATLASEADLRAEIAKLKRRLEREKKSRVDAEGIAERGMRALYDKQRQLELLEKVAAAANESTSLNEAIRTTLVQVCEYTGWQVGNSFLAEMGSDQSYQLISTGTWHAVNKDHDYAYDLVTRWKTFDAGQGLPGRALSTKAPVWIVDVVSDNNFPRAELARKAGLKAAFAFPVMAGAHVAAVLEFFSDKAHPEDPVLLSLMGQIGTQLGRVVDRKRSQDQLVHNALHDSLTGLPNRALFLERLTSVIARKRRRPETKYGVLFMDLDHFKFVNDSLGHLAGDALIIGFGRRIADALRWKESDDGPGGSQFASTLARLGGDEFVILVEDIKHGGDVVAVADMIQQLLTQPFMIEGQELFASASVGVIADPAVDVNADDVLRNADLALYRAKALGKSQHALYDESMHQEAMKRLKLESELRLALRKNEFIVYYQPIVDLPDMEVVGFEALVRWNRNGEEIVGPAEFIEVAEDTGIILPLGLWVLETACRAFQGLAEEPGRQQQYVSVNLSARQFAQADLVIQIANIIKKTGLAPQRLRLEITESVAMVDADRARRVLEELRAIGVKLAIDDFGTGYSSLSCLQDYPLEILKIDRSFVNRMRQGDDGLQMVQTIINLARSLRMKVVAEGVESPDELALLKSMGCDLGQGYLFSKPVPENVMRQLAAAPRQEVEEASGNLWMTG